MQTPLKDKSDTYVTGKLGPCHPKWIYMPALVGNVKDTLPDIDLGPILTLAAGEVHDR